ncbi:indole-3-glycerol phosphate synthase TrpC [Neobacillus sp. D3-1R]|uniref:indole-3-glycerol phosphate synthase TrpC n=1 Tax=Neobacillus sp. D3-1R TaxID=3445778 RepID=UPI003FA04370
METILDRIIAEKRKEVQDLQEFAQLPISSNKEYSFIRYLEKANHLGVIAEFKRASPSKGNINIRIEPDKQAKLYEKNGAAAISVLTDSTFFKGSFQDLKAVRDAVDLPILCKDFIIDPIQIEMAKNHGANIILLIAAALSHSDLEKLYQYAKLQNLEVLVEVHDEEDVEKALRVNPRLLGINNRNLKTFEVDLEVTERLLPIIQPTGAFVISESGIFSREDAQRVRDAGAKGILVGEALMRSSNLSLSLKDLMVPTSKGAIK